MTMTCSAEEREIRRLLARGDREIEQGRGYSLDEVMAKADALLADGKPTPIHPRPKRAARARPSGCDR